MSWDSILGHEFAKRYLRHQIDTGRLAQGVLLVGPEGIGKRRLALEVAKTLNCTAASGRPCDACRTCSQIARGIHPDVHQLAPGGASVQIKIDGIRQVLGRIALRPFNAAVQVVILDGAERLTEEAANALLKALEEPSASTRFVLTTAQLPDCLPTIVSRCQVIRCPKLPAEAIVTWLVQEDVCDAATAKTVAALADGSLARARTLADDWEAHQQLLARLGRTESTVWVEQPMPQTREEVADLLDLMVLWLRGVAVTAATGHHAATDRMQADAIVRQASRVDADRCVETALALLSLRESLEQYASPRLVAAVARERWLTLQQPSVHSPPSTVHRGTA